MSTPTQTTRVIASKPKIGARPTISAPTPPEEPAPAKRSRKGVVIAVVLVLLAAAAAWWFLLGPGATAEDPVDEAEVAVTDGRPEGEPGEILTTEAISINLADGHFLRIGLGLELSDSAEDVSSAKALDATIALFSGKPVGEVRDPEAREALKQELLTRLWAVYDGDVLDVYFTDFVTQ